MQHVQRRVHVLHGPLATLPEHVAIGTLLITPGSLGLGQPARLEDPEQVVA